MTQKEQIGGAYRQLGESATFYDGMITCSTPLGKAINRIVWGMDREQNNLTFEKALSGIPEDFAGRLLEVPVGTGVITMPVYQTLPEAEITCLDYSQDMMDNARRRAAQLGLTNVSFVRGDVGALPFEDESFDAVLSLNGFHAFPDKDAAWRETFRVLKKGGVFCGCFYVKDRNRRTDWFIDKLYRPAGFFTPPFETVPGLRARLKRLYREVSVEAVEGLACFCCIK
ncbi:MAG: class I SAM-dependent methyltransferase [Ruminococcaceae bacterium]|jgi:ubiquinone/menaquinone biosynthesis C-methylase UbiE|nr:class I SAM-dependent methyltransferase [Oscillospiraceae bacterium]